MSRGILSPPTNVRPPGLQHVGIQQNLNEQIPADLTFTDDSGRGWAMPRPTNGSADFTALAGSDGFVELLPGPMTHPKGFVTRLYRW